MISKTMSLRKENRREFCSYVIPSVLAFVLSGVYTIVDGFFVGQSMGDAGIAAITIGFPVCAFIQAIGTGIGLSGAIKYTLMRARGDEAGAKQCFTATAVLMILLSMIITVVFVVFSEQSMYALGARGQVLAMAAEYVRVVAFGTIFQLMATGLVPFVRNMEGASVAMTAMILGFVTNTILDYVFIWKMDMAMTGAALGTVIGQLMTVVVTMVFFVVKRCGIGFMEKRKTFGLWADIIKLGFSPFGLTFSPTLTLLFMNKFLLIYGTEHSVAVFGCIDYVMCIIYMLIQGVGDGSQPLISRCYGEDDFGNTKHMRTMAYKAAAAIGAVFIIAVYFSRNQIGPLFGASESANEEVAYYIPWFLATLMLLVFTRITTTYFYATEKTVLSYVLVYGEPLLTFLLLCILPVWLDLTGVWLAMPVAQVIMFLIAVLFKIKSDAGAITSNAEKIIKSPLDISANQ